MATERTEWLFVARDQASATINRIDGGLSRLASVSKGLGGIAVAAGLGYGVAQASQLAFELGSAAIKAQSLRTEFDGLAGSIGTSGSALLSTLRTASNGAISDVELVGAANRAVMLNVAQSADDMDKLMRIAIGRGRALGVSATQAFNDIVTGLGRMSPLILDNLGILTGGEQVFDDYATAIGKTKAELTDLEKRQALFNKVIAESQQYLTSPVQVTSIERMQAALSNASMEMGKLFAPAVASVAERIANAINGINDALDGVNTTAERNRILEQIRELRAEAERIQTEGMRGGGILGLLFAGGEDQLVQGRLEAIGQSIEFLERQLRESMGADLTGPLQGAATQAEALESALYGTQAGANASAAGASTAANAWAAAIPVFGQAAAAQRALFLSQFDSQEAQVFGQLEQSAAQLVRLGVPIEQVGRMWAGAQERAGRYFDQVQAQATSSYDQLAGDQEATNLLLLQGVQLVEELNAPMATYADQLIQAEQNANKLATATGGISQEFNDIAAAVSGALAGAFDGETAGIDADDLLPRAEAVDENARRLADIAVNGLTGQEWLGEFAAEAPELWEQIRNSSDPAGTAAQLLKDFQDGLFSGTDVLVDKGRAKELARRALLGDANRQELADEIAQELAAEMGVSLSKASAAIGGVLGTESSAPAPTSISLQPTVDLDTESLLAELDAALTAGSLDDVEFAAGITATIILDAITPPSEFQVAAVVDKVAGAFPGNVTWPFGITSFVSLTDVLAPSEFQIAAVKDKVVGSLPQSITWTTGVVASLDLAGIIPPSEFQVAAVAGSVVQQFGDTVAWTPKIDVDINPAEPIIPPSEFQIAAVKGLVEAAMPDDIGFGSLGGGIGASILSAFSESNVGSDIILELVRQINGGRSMVESQAKATADWWGLAFLAKLRQGVPSELIDLLVAEVGPRVSAAQAAEASTSGAAG